MRRTRALDLIVPFVAVGVIGYVLLKFNYDSLPPLGDVTPVPLAALAVTEFVVARRVRAAVRHDPMAKPMTAIAIARSVALGKASSIVGAATPAAAKASVKCPATNVKCDISIPRPWCTCFIGAPV